VDEGIEQYDEFESKLNASTTQSQKDRWEGEMKKEIKRLQRLRDQIKGWQTLSEIKEKEPLMESRKKIEGLMEKFKSLEKDLKIKAYSREGLIAASKLDPREKEKMDATQWLTSMVDRLQTQVDAFEAEMEASLLTLKKTNRRNEKSFRQLQLEDNLSRHKAYISKLEILLRQIENEAIQAEDISDLKDYMEYFIESHDVRLYPIQASLSTAFYPIFMCFSCRMAILSRMRLFLTHLTLMPSRTSLWQPKLLPPIFPHEKKTRRKRKRKKKKKKKILVTCLL
jgi:CCR4-NOT transcriptional regulation complex NOT5 subunit